MGDIKKEYASHITYHGFTRPGVRVLFMLSLPRLAGSQLPCVCGVMIDVVEKCGGIDLGIALLPSKNES
jgi:hypothetical protein